MPPKSHIKINKRLKFNKIIAELEARGNMLEEYIPNIPESNINGKHIDRRDFFFMCYLLKGQGNNQTEINNDIKRQYKEMVTAFIKDDKETIKKYLDMMYDASDDLPNIYRRGIKTKEDFIQVYAIHRLSQALNIKRNENTDYFYNRYKTPTEQQKFNSCLMLQETLKLDLAILQKNIKQLNIRGLIPYKESIEGGFDINADFAMSFNHTMETQQNEISYKVPSNIEKNNQTLEIANNYLHNSFTDCLGGELVGYNLKTILNNNEFIFVGDKSVKELALESLKDNPLYQNGSDYKKASMLNEQCNKEFTNAMLKGDKVISIVSAKKENGQIVFEETRIKPVVTDLKPTREDLKKHSWVRRNLFNWGPFKIKRSQESVNRLYDNAPKNNPSIINKAKDSFYKAVDKKREAFKDKNLELEEKSKQVDIKSATEFLNKKDIKSKLKDEFNEAPVDLSNINIDNNSKVKENVIDIE